MNYCKLLNFKILIISFVVVIKGFSQVPTTISYQGVARNSNGQTIPNQQIALRLSLLETSASQNAIYTETHSVVTSNQGLFSLQIGGGVPTVGSYTSINWANGPRFIRTEIDPIGGSNFVLSTISPLNAVPFALYSISGTPGPQGPPGTIQPGTTPGQMMYWDGSTWKLVAPGEDGQVLTFCNGVPHWGPCPNGNTVVDVEGNVYQTVVIGSQVWMAENLRVGRFKNNETILTGLTDSQWSSVNIAAMSTYDNSVLNDTTFGKLYNFYAVTDNRGLCPAGWHVATDSDWKTLESFLGMPANELDLSNVEVRGLAQNVGGKLRSVSALWSINANSTNSSGFSGLPGGYRSYVGQFFGISDSGQWWTNTGASSGYGWARSLTGGQGFVGRYDAQLQNGLSVRCVKD